MVHAWIIEDAPYHILLGCPFQLAAHADMEEVGDVLILMDPKRWGHLLHVPMQPHVSAAGAHTHFYQNKAHPQEGRHPLTMSTHLYSLVLSYNLPFPRCLLSFHHSAGPSWLRLTNLQHLPWVFIISWWTEKCDQLQPPYLRHLVPSAGFQRILYTHCHL
jgi:hypothetical protein